jgi:ribonuclease HI
MQYKINFDGGKIVVDGKDHQTIGIVIKDENQNIVYVEGDNLGPGTTNQAEGHALLLSLIRAVQLGYTDLFVEGDSQLIINQSTGKWQCRHENLIPIISKVKKIASVPGINIIFNWVRRDFNKEADEQTHIGRTKPINEKLRNQLYQGNRKQSATSIVK